MPPQKRKQWCPDAMKKAYEAIKNKEMGYLKASKVFKVPKSTLEYYVKNPKDLDELIATKLGRKPTFSPDIEGELAKYCLEMVQRYYGLRASDIRVMAFQLAIKNNIPHQFSSKGEAGKKWMTAFLKRNPSLSFRTPEATTAMRARGFTKEKVSYFFDDILEPELAKVNFDPVRIFNVDETGVTIVQHKMAKVLCRKGQKQVGGISSAERGGLVTLVFCMSAAGVFVPPLFIFPRVNMKKELEDRAPPGSIFGAHKSGWIQLHLFTKWFQHFLDFVKPSKEQPVVLILDGHFSHTRNLDVIKMAKDSGVILISIPPHSSHKIQPLDVGFMSPFKTYYAQEIETWLRANPGRTVSAYQISELVNKAYSKAATLEIATKAFEKTGICPFNKNIFRDHDFAVNDDQTTNLATVECNDNSDTQLSQDEQPKSPLPSTSAAISQENIPVTPSSKLLVSPQMIVPLPSIATTSKQTKRQCKPTVLTSSPYKLQLEESMQDKTKVAKTSKRVGKKTKTVKAKKIKKSDSSSEDTDTEIVLESEDENNGDEEDASCTYCTQYYSCDTQGEKWIKCIVCYQWCHELCSGVDETKAIDFICDFCIERH